MLSSLRAGTATLLCAVVLLGLAGPVLARPVIDPDLLERVRSSSLSTEAAAAARVRAPSPAVSTENGRVWADVWMSGRIDPAAIRALGGEVHSVAGSVMTARIPLEAASQLDRVAGLERVQLAQPIQFQSDMAAAEIGVENLWGGPPPAYSYGGSTGRGVVVGIVDTGIDPNHADFWTTAGTRIQYIWDQSISSGTRPSGYTYGSEYTAAQINARTCPTQDTEGHGTHVAGVAAGNGRATGNGQPAYHFIGMAPEADLVVVKLRAAVDGTVTDDKVLDGTRYVFERAAMMGKPAVVLLAVGKMTGPHDGQDPFDLAITALTGPGRIVCVAAGNFGGDGRHAEWRPTPTARTGRMTFTIPTYAPSSVALDIMKIEAWYGANANNTVSIITPSGQTIGPVALGATTEVASAAGMVKITNGVYTSAPGDRRVDIQISRGNLSYPQVATGTWTLQFTQAGKGIFGVDAWITYYVLGAVKPKFVGGMTERCLVSSPATANQVVSVGAYSTRRYWTAINGQTYGLNDAHVGEIAPSSSPGPRRDGVMVPDLAAPGFPVASSRSSSYYPSDMYLTTDGGHVILYGTSVAAASAAGTIALQMQHQPTMTPDQAGRLRFHALADENTGPAPNPLWGWGKLRVPQMMAGIGNGSAATVDFSLASRNPASGSISFQLALSAADVARRARVAIMDLSGRVVASLDAKPQAGTQRLTWSGRSSFGSAVPAGVYWARLITGSRTRTRSFVWLH